jgi:predicted transcriptional regulator
MKINGEILRKIREERLVSVSELADWSTVSSQTLYLIERGKQVKIENIRKVLQGLQLSIEEAKAKGLIYDD